MDNDFVPSFNIPALSIFPLRDSSISSIVSGLDAHQKVPLDTAWLPEDEKCYFFEDTNFLQGLEGVVCCLMRLRW